MDRKYIAAGTEYNTRAKHVFAPILRREFACKNTISCAELEISVAGFYRLFLNGKELTKGYFAPYVSNPDHIIYFDKYDISSYLQENNVLCVWLGNGFNNSSDGGVWEFESAPFRSAPKMFVSVTVDGEQVLTSDENFEVCKSAITYDDYRCGERYDARLENAEIFKLGYRGESINAIVVDSPKGEYREATAYTIKRFGEMKPVAITRLEKGYLYKFGQNNAGIYRLKINGREGQVIDLHFGEFTQKGKLEQSNIMLFDRGITGYAHHDQYVCREGLQEWEPSFTYHGYQYVYVEGLDEDQATEDLLTYVVLHSDFPHKGEFACDNEIISKVQECTLRSDLSCFHYFPTDCPQREKNGWTGDIAISSEQYLYNFDCAEELREWLNNVRKAQRADGALPGIVPTSGWGYEWGNGPGWDSVIVEVPYWIYHFTGNKEVLKENAGAILAYFRYLKTKKTEEGLIAFGLGDWLEIGANHEGAYRTPLEVSDTLVCVSAAKKAKKMFLEIGLENEAAEIEAFETELIETFRKRCVDQGVVRGRTQAGQAMALSMGIFDEQEYTAAYEILKDIIREDGNVLRVGMIAARYFFDVLTRAGECELLFDMIHGPKYPSYGYWMTHGMTTLNEAFLEFEEDRYPEELIRKDGRGQLTSLNHHVWGFVSAWFYKHLAGLSLTGPNSVKIQPSFVKQLDFARASYSNQMGKIVVEWCRQGKEITLSVENEGFALEMCLPQGYVLKQEKTTGNSRIYQITVQMEDCL
jgi:alpha-L-rhamnosidase